MPRGTIPAPDPDESGRVRARAEARLRGGTVRTPGAGTTPMDDRAFVSKLTARATSDAIERSVPGDRLSAAALGVRERRVTLQPAPNAPLLMRIVRTPYALDPVRPRRSAAWDRPSWDRPEPLPRPGLEWTANRPGRLFRSPLRIEHGLPRRLRPRRGDAARVSG